MGDRVWFMKDNKPTEAIVSGIKIFYVATNQDSIHYTAKRVEGSQSWLDYSDLNEKDLFKSKEELVASL